MRHLPVLAGLFRNEVVWCSQVPFCDAGGHHKQENLHHHIAPPRGDAWRMPARKEAGKQTAQNPEVHHNSSLLEAFPGFGMCLY